MLIHLSDSAKNDLFKLILRLHWLHFKKEKSVEFFSHDNIIICIFYDEKFQNSSLTVLSFVGRPTTPISIRKPFN